MYGDQERVMCKVVLNAIQLQVTLDFGIIQFYITTKACAVQIFHFILTKYWIIIGKHCCALSKSHCTAHHTGIVFWHVNYYGMFSIWIYLCCVGTCQVQHISATGELWSLWNHIFNRPLGTAFRKKTKRNPGNTINTIKINGICRTFLSFDRR